MNLVELVLFAALSAALLTLGYFLSLKYGAAGWLVGVVPVGAAWAWFIFGAFRATFTEIRHSLNRRPVCRQGNCRSKDYVMIKATREKAVFRCRCGDLYASKDNRFSRILQDGSLVPYMLQDASRHWKADTTT